MSIHLVVKEAFGDYRRGDRIEDEETVEKILASDNEGHVLKVEV